MRNRFYFSYAQQTDYHRCWVKVGDKWVEYTEWCEDEVESSFKDAKLVYETDELPEIRVEGEMDTPY